MPIRLQRVRCWAGQVPGQAPGRIIKVDRTVHASVRFLNWSACTRLSLLHCFRDREPKLTFQIIFFQASDENATDRELILQLQDALASERPPAVVNLDRLYREAGVVLPGRVGRRFEQVERFHEAVVQNRKSHLTSEVQAAEARIAERDRTRQRIDARRQQLMEILRSGSALEHYALLQGEAGRAEAEADGLRQQLATAERIELRRDDRDYIVFCFARSEDADAFCARFGGERLLETRRSPAIDYDGRRRLGATAIARHSASAERAFTVCWKSVGDRWSPIYHSGRIASSTARHRDARASGGVVLDFDLRGWAGFFAWLQVP
jgi:hypothetical protein